MNTQDNSFTVTLKTNSKEATELTVTPNSTVEELKTHLSVQTGHHIDKIKLVYKGKIIENQQTMQSLDITQPAVIIVVYSKHEKKENDQPSIAPIMTSLQTGLGDFNPVGFGNFGISVMIQGS